MCQWHSAAVSSSIAGPRCARSGDLARMRRRRTSDPRAPCRPGCRRGSAGSSTVPAFISPTSSCSAGELVHRPRFGRLRVDDRGADVAERLVHRVRQRVNGRRLAVARDHEAAAACGLQILDERRRSSAAPASGAVAPPAPATPSCAATARAKRFDLRGAQRQAVIGLRAGVGRRALDRVEAVELRAVAFDAPPRGERARVLQARRRRCRGSRRRATG